MNLRQIVFSKTRDICCVEQTQIGGIIIPLIKMKNYDVYIYGAGKDISSILLYFWTASIQIKGIIDCDKNKSGKYVLNEVPIIHPNEMSICNQDNTIAIINTKYFTGLEQQEILQCLRNKGIEKFYPLNEYDKWQMFAQSYNWTDSERIDYYRNHFFELEKSYEMLYDTESKNIMMEYIRAYTQMGVYKLEEIDGSVKYFFGKKKEDTYEKLYTHLENEVWINCGSSIGDNIFQYFANGLNAEIIYAYEADKEAYRNLCNNLKYLPDEYKKKVKTVNEYIDGSTEFKKELKDKKVTLINADIEGGELSLLYNIRNIIKKDRPVLAICAYHKASDLVDLIQFLNDLVEDYVYMLRKYMASFGSANRTAELVLYAIPKERKIM